MSMSADTLHALPPGEKQSRHSGPTHPARHPVLVLRSAEFRRGREHIWRQLDDMLGRIETKGIRSLSAEEVQQLPLLYRATVSSLSVARTIALDRNLLLYLEDLSLRAYLTVYGPRSGILENLGDFFRRGFPRSVRVIRWHLAIALVALGIGIIAGYLMVSADMSYFTMLVPEGLAGSRGPGSSADDLIHGELFAPWPGFVETFIVFANSLFRHNTIVGILCFGLGFALGLPTLLLIVHQGLILGALIALHASRGLAIDFIGWLSIHGVTEILAILLCGAAGLLIAEKIMFPGTLTRLESLARYGRLAAGIVAGSVVLFFIAGILEGGFRQLINNTPGRYAFAATTTVLWLAYFMSGRTSERQERLRDGDTH